MAPLFLIVAASVLALSAADRNAFDCPMREMAVEFAAFINPQLTALQLQEVADALNGDPAKAPGCNVTVPTGLGSSSTSRFKWAPLPKSDLGNTYYIDPVNGNDANSGTITSPFQSIPRGVAATEAGTGAGIIILRAGTYYLHGLTVNLTTANSGLTIQAYPGEETWISGATNLNGVVWTPYNQSGPYWTAPAVNNNCVYGETEPVINSQTPDAVTCQTQCQANFSAGGGCNVWTWHDANQGGFANDCIFRFDDQCNNFNQSGHTSGWYVAGANTYSANLASFNLPSAVKGLRVNGQRGIRARYPNANPELGFGSSLSMSSWFGPVVPIEPAFEFRPDSPQRNTSDSFQYYQLGVGGICEGELGFNPPAGYWCGNMTEGGGAFTWRTPIGSTATSSVLPNQPYKHNGGDGIVLQVWHPSKWASRMYLIGPGGYTWTPDNTTGTFLFARGGFQDGRGSNDGGNFYIENALEELDSPNEWYYDEPTQTLYFAYNGTGAPPTDGSVAVIPDGTQVMFNITGNQQYPVYGVSFLGIGFRDSAYSYMADHTIPSGGDWALARTASLFAEGTENLLVQGCVFERLDNNALMLSSYNRGAQILDNEFVWLGESAIVSWGTTEGAPVPTFGPDGTAGNQPRGTQIRGNYVHELGIWEKQSSFYMQAISCQNTLSGNVMYNGPRAGINFNDGFGGGNSISSTLLFNTCRESGDHGPFNSWDRVPWLWDVDAGWQKLNDTISHTFMISNYQGQEAIDNDDGTAYYHSFDNFLAYSGNGMKNDFGGHSNYHTNNIYAYVGQGFGICSQLEGQQDTFAFNTVWQTKDGNYANGACSDPGKTIVQNNSIYSPTGAITECGMSLAAWQAEGNDPGTTASPYVNDTQLLAWSRALLGLGL